MKDATSIYKSLSSLDKTGFDQLIKKSGSGPNGNLKRVFYKLAKETSESEFVKLATAGSLPPVKLTKDDMNVLCGGNWLDEKVKELAYEFGQWLYEVTH